MEDKRGLNKHAKPTAAPLLMEGHILLVLHRRNSQRKKNFSNEVDTGQLAHLRVHGTGSALGMKYYCKLQRKTPKRILQCNSIFC